jgi:hypothetical protein
MASFPFLVLLVGDVKKHILGDSPRRLQTSPHHHQDKLKDSKAQKNYLPYSTDYRKYRHPVALFRIRRIHKLSGYPDPGQ